MSQAKVDRYKKEKKNRAKTIKKQKVKKAAWIIVGAAFLGCVIGYPLGRQLYKVSSEQRKASATIDADLYPYWIQQYWGQQFTGILGGDTGADETETDASPTDANTEADTADVTGSDAE